MQIFPRSLNKLPLLLGGACVGWGIYLVSTDRTARGEPSDLLLPGDDAL